MEYGDCEGETGYWVEDDETGDCGFLPENIPHESDDAFYVFDDEEEAWTVRRFQSRGLRKGSQPRTRGKGKGSKGRKRFRPRKQGKKQETQVSLRRGTAKHSLQNKLERLPRCQRPKV